MYNRGMTFQKQILIIGSLFAVPLFAFALPTISTFPSPVEQGQALMIKISGATLNDIAKIYVDGKSLWFFNYNGSPTAFYAIDLNAEPGEKKIRVLMEDGSEVEKTFMINERQKIEAPLGIPDKLGGNTPEAATSLVTNLGNENSVINSLLSTNKKFWTESFRYPLKYPTVTDSYGYLRKTGYYSIPHKGTDFRAPEGYRVYAINRGVVKLARTFTIYGKTVAVDHGLGVISYYMHLSRIDVKEGQTVGKGQVLGLSGKTGYAESPHLHLSVKINGISIDPNKFISLFQY
ncbi:MAG: hypothetical protein A3B08_04275 [Candidatus Taylorbacteria bacterium RIFCSPLOWO2_01_FULL_43_44]|nr:MAG: hypothetical protein A3B08_04275 [Candidatus Taylorbacteria bacterium RIFCSPLOWO2_01_FULL_43_44]